MSLSITVSFFRFYFVLKSTNVNGCWLLLCHYVDHVRNFISLLIIADVLYISEKEKNRVGQPEVLTSLNFLIDDGDYPTYWEHIHDDVGLYFFVCVLNE